MARPNQPPLLETNGAFKVHPERRRDAEPAALDGPVPFPSSLAEVPGA